MNTMKRIKIEKDIKVFYIQAKSFPDGVMEAFQKMHSLIEFTSQRRNFGISRSENGASVPGRTNVNASTAASPAR